MTKTEYDQAEAFLIVKYGSVEKAIDIWLEMDEEEDGFDMMTFFLMQPAKFDDDDRQIKQ